MALIRHLKALKKRLAPKRLPMVYQFEAIGTLWSIESTTAFSATVKTIIQNHIAEFDTTYSRFRDDSLVAKLRQPGTYMFPADVVELLHFYKLLYQVTDGSVTPLVGETLEHAGYDGAYSLRPKSGTVTPPPWDDVMEWNKTKVEVKRPIVLDVGAAGKGYLVDSIAALLKSNGITDAVIDASGDICHYGTGVERVGLENPYDESRVIGIAEIKNNSLCASSSNRRKWSDDWHHIVDPKTGKPVQDVIATWVIADSTMVADGLATALFFVPFEVLSKWQFEAVRLRVDGTIEKTDNFSGELFL